MKTSATRVVDGAQIIAPSPRHYIDARAGVGTGLGLGQRRAYVQWTFADGRPGVARVPYALTVVKACNRRAPQHWSSARLLAEFFHN